MAVGSTFLNSLGLERYGLRWRWPEIDCAHPLDNGDGGVLQRSLNDTAAGLASDGPRWRSIFGKPSATFDVLPASTTPGSSAESAVPYDEAALLIPKTTSTR